LSIGADRGERGDWILLSGRDPSTFSSTRSANFPSVISANFFYIDEINKFCSCCSSQIASTDPDGIRHGHHRQDLHQQLDCTGASDSHDRSHLKLDLEKFNSYLIWK
jgi:hypothetical protein